MAKRPAKQTSVNVSMPPKVREIFEGQMKRGGFDNASEYVRHLVREEEKRIAPEWLEDLIEEGLKGPFEEADDRWWAERRAKLDAAIKRMHGRRRRSA